MIYQDMEDGRRLVEYDEEPDMDELLDSLGHNANDCQWMFSKGDITFHKEVLK